MSSRCQCGIEVEPKQCQNGQHAGRWFVACPKPKGQGCKYFQWITHQPPASGVNAQPVLDWKRSKPDSAPYIKPWEQQQQQHLLPPMPQYPGIAPGFIPSEPTSTGKNPKEYSYPSPFPAPMDQHQQPTDDATTMREDVLRLIQDRLKCDEVLQRVLTSIESLNTHIVNMDARFMDMQKLLTEMRSLRIG